MKQEPRQQKHFSTTKLLVIGLMLPRLLFYSSCLERTSVVPQPDIEKTTKTISAGACKKFEEPFVTSITAGNQPRVARMGQPAIITDSTNGGAPFFTNYHIDEGLPVNNIICSANDRWGNLWFGTGGGGVTRFDGKTFTTYNMTQGLAGNNVFCIMEDSAGNMWIGTSSGLSRYNGHSFLNYTTGNGLAGNFITALAQDSAGNIWVATNEGVSRFDGQSFSNYHTAQGLPDNYVRCMMRDENGNLWLGTNSGGVSKFDGKHFFSFTTREGLAGNSVNCITIDHDQNLWFGTSNGVSKFDGNRFTNFTTRQGLANNHVNCMVQDKDGMMWLGTDSKTVSCFDGRRFTNYPGMETAAEAKLKSFLVDKAGNLWISWQGGGVFKYEGDAFRNFTAQHGLPANLVFWICRDNKGNLWFATYQGGVSKYDGRHFYNFSTAQGLLNDKVWSVLQDKDGNMWFGSEAGLNKFDGTSLTTYTSKQGLPNNAIISIMQDKEGNIWVGTRASGVAKFDQKHFYNYTTAQGLAGNNIWGMLQDKAGNLWFATHDGGASKFDGKNFVSYTTSQGLAGNTLSAILQDKEGNIWFATDGNGVSRFNGKNFVNYTTEQGLADNGVSSMQEDTGRNMLWFGTTRGLSGLHENQVQKSAEQANQFENFGQMNGDPLKDASTGALFLDKTGLLWLGSGTGKLVRFNYTAAHLKKPSPVDVKILSVKINNETICWNNLAGHNGWEMDSLSLTNEMMTSFGKALSQENLLAMRKRYREIRFDSITPFYPVPVHLVVPYAANTLTIDFAAVTPALSKQVTYQYKLEGLNNTWSSPTSASTAVFANLKASNYTFRVRAKSPLGDSTEAAWSFRVLPPWWFTWWAVALYIGLLLATGFMLARMHTQTLKRKQAAKLKMMAATQQQERVRISRDLHDDIGARLTNINLLSALALNKTNDRGEVTSFLNRIAGEIQTSAEALDDIVWNIDTKNDAIDEVIARMRRYTASVFDRTSIRCTIEAVENALPPRIAAGERRDLFFVFKEAINNIQKHARATEVTIQIACLDHKLTMQITDNGVGFDTGEPTHRNGIKNIRQRMQKWNAACAVQSTPGNGTTISVSLPIQTTSLKRGMRNRFRRR